MNETNPTSTETLLGGGTITVTKKDGTSESVTVRQLAIKELPRLAASLEDECAQAEIYCGKEKGWADTITDKSVVAIVVEGERINSDFFGQWVQRRMNRINQLVPGGAEKLVEKFAGSLAKS